MLQIEGLTRRYGKFVALDHLDLTIETGTLHGFVGPNGAGKTTTMRILATLLPASEGKAWIDGMEVSRQPRLVRKMVGYMPDFFGVYDGLKVSEYLDFYARCYGLRSQERTQMADQMLELVRLTDKREAYVDTLSRGMKQRLCLARSLMHNPSLLILDEPASGMDPRARAEMKSILRTLKDLGKTVLISSHILHELAELCDAISIIDHGKLLFSGNMDALSRRMSKEGPIEIRVEDGMDTAITLLKEHEGVRGLEMEDDLLRVTFEGDAAQLLKRLVQGGVDIRDFHRTPVNLETAFMEVTQES